MGTEKYTGLSSRAIIGTFYQKLEEKAGASWIDKIAMRFNSNQESETYNWIGMTPAMREWVGGRQAKGFLANGITIKNKTFESTLEVSVDDLRRDKTSQLNVRIAELATRAITHWKSLLTTIIINTANALCYDGQYFFDTDHSEGASGYQSNSISVDISALGCGAHGVIAAPSDEEMMLCILQAIGAILGFKDDQGEPLNDGASSFTVMVPVSLMPAAVAAVTKDTLEYGRKNLLLGSGFSIDLAVNPRLTWTVDFAVFRTDGDVKPLIAQEEEGVSISAIAEGSEEEFKNNRHLYGVKAIRNVGFGYWSHACKVTMT